MLKARSLFFAAMIGGVGLSTASYAATEPQRGSYVMSGKVTAVTATGGASCVATGTTLTGYSYFPGVQGKGNGFTIVIPPAGSVPGVLYYFPPMSNFSGAAWNDVLNYVLPPSGVVLNASFSLTFTAYTASSFTIILRTLTIAQGSSQSVAPSGSTCHTTYSLNFTLGLPTNLF